MSDNNAVNSDNAPVNFIDLLNKPLSDSQRPNLPGSKHFYGRIIAVEDGESSTKKTPCIRFRVRLTDPSEDVTDEEMKKITDKGMNLSDYEVYADFYWVPRAMFMLDNFLVSLGAPENANKLEVLSVEVSDPNRPPRVTSTTNDKFRGLEVICKTGAADDQGRVFPRLEMLAGVKR